MENALDKALANAVLNARMNGDTLHTENLDSIADLTLDEPNPDYPNYVVVPKPPEYDPKDVAFKPKAYVVNNPKQDTLLYAAIKTVDAKVAALTDHIVELKVATHMISTTITNAASMQSESSHKHRSLHEWDDSQLLNELVERENDLMPFYFELLKRIPQNLQGHVDESMKGKYQSLGVLSKLCAALSYVQQPQPAQAFEVGLSESANHRMDEAFKAATSPQAYTPEQLANVRVIRPEEMSNEELLQYQEFQRNAFNKAAGKHARSSPPLSPFIPYQTIPPQG